MAISKKYFGKITIIIMNSKLKKIESYFYEKNIPKQIQELATPKTHVISSTFFATPM